MLKPITSRFTGEQNNAKFPSRHPGRLGWPGTMEGFPVLMPEGGRVGHITREQWESLPIENHFFFKAFKTWDEQSMVEYKDVMDHVYDGKFTITRQSTEEWVPDKEGWTFFMAWIQHYGRLPSDGSPVPATMG